MPPTRPSRSDRFVSDETHLIVSDVERNILLISKELKKCAKIEGKFEDEVKAHKTLENVLPYAKQIYKDRKEQITKVKPLDKHKIYFKAEDIENIHLALISYTMENGPYTEFNEETRKLLTCQISSSKYTYTIYLTHVWLGLTCFHDPLQKFPEVLYRGVRAFTGNMKEGQIFAFPSLVSTTELFKVAKQFSSADGAIFRIKIGDRALNGLAMVNHSVFPEEQEFLLEPTHAYEITGFDNVDGTRIIDCIVSRGMYV